MSKSFFPLAAAAATGTITFSANALSVGSDLKGIGAIPGNAVELLANPLALTSVLAAGGILVAADLWQAVAADRASKRAEFDHHTATRILLRIFADTDELRRRAPFAGVLIDQIESGDLSLNQLQVDSDDPAYPTIALYRATKAGQNELLAELQRLAARLGCPRAPVADLTPLLRFSEETARIQLDFLESNHTALLSLISDSAASIQTVLAHHTVALRTDLSKITGFLGRMEGKLDDQTTRLQRMETMLIQALEAKSEGTRADAQAFSIQDISQEEIVADLARRLGISVETLRAGIDFGLKSEDLLTRSRAELLSGDRGAAITAAEKAKQLYTNDIRRCIAADEILAQAYYEKGDYLFALAARQRITDLLDQKTQSLAWASAQHEVALILFQLARHGEAVALLREVIVIQERELSPEDCVLMRSLTTLAVSLRAQGNLADSELLCRRILMTSEAKLGNNHPNFATDLNNLAHVVNARGNVAEAEVLYRRALAISETKLGKKHPEVAIRYNNLAYILIAQSKSEEAEQLCRKAIEIWEERNGKDHPNVATGLNNLVSSLQAQGKLAEAEQLCRRALMICETKLGNNHPNVATELNNLVAVLIARRKFTEIEPLIRRAVGIAFFHRKRNGTPFQYEPQLVNNYTRLLGKMGRSSKQIEAAIRKLKHNVGLED